VQAPVALLTVMTIPPGATAVQERMVIDGIRGAIFVYANGGPVGALVISIASQPGTDPYGNVYPFGIALSPPGQTTDSIQIRPDLDAILIYE
jgi:hypothetical protein